jgi:hypothetical protein
MLSEQPENSGASQASLPSVSTDGSEGQVAPQAPAQPGGTSEAGHPTPEEIAERVYELFRRDLRVYLERKGR